MAMDKENFFEECASSIMKYDKARTQELAKKAVDEGMDLMDVTEKGFSIGIAEMGDLFGSGEIFLPELIKAADAMKVATDILSAAMPKTEAVKKGTIVIGTAPKDIHDIGKTLVASYLQATGFEVHDLGIDVKIQTFIDKAKDVNADIIGMSAMITTTMPSMRKLIEALEEADMRNKIKVMVGGAPVSQSFADSIGADAYGADTVDAAIRAKELVS